MIKWSNIKFPKPVEGRSRLDKTGSDEVSEDLIFTVWKNRLTVYKEK